MREPRTSLEQAAMAWARVYLQVYSDDLAIGFTEADWQWLSLNAPKPSKDLLLALNASDLLSLPIDKYKDPGTDAAPRVASKVTEA